MAQDGLLVAAEGAKQALLVGERHGHDLVIDGASCISEVQMRRPGIAGMGLAAEKAALLDRIPMTITVKNKGSSTVEVPPLRIADDAVTIVVAC